MSVRVEGCPREAVEIFVTVIVWRARRSRGPSFCVLQYVRLVSTNTHLFIHGRSGKRATLRGTTFPAATSRRFIGTPPYECLDTLCSQRALLGQGSNTATQSNSTLQSYFVSVPGL